MSLSSSFTALAGRAALAAALLAPVLPAAAQTFSWAQPRAITYANNPEMLRTAAGIAPGGRHYWWAALEQKREFHSQEALGSVNLTRMRAGGVVAAQRIAEGNASILQLQATSDGGALLLGEYKDSLVYDPQHRYISNHFNSGLEYFLTALDSTGAVRWHRRVRGEGIAGSPDFYNIQNADALVLDPRGGSAWVGYGTFGDCYATRFDLATGDSLTSIIEHDVSLLTSIAVAPDGTVYVAGSCAGQQPTYAGVTAPPPTTSHYNMHVVCYDPSGAFRWVQYVEDVTCPHTWVATADTGGVYFAGNLFGPWQFGSFQATISTFNSGAFFLTRLSHATGTFEWLRESPNATSGRTAPAQHQPLATDAAGNAWLLTNTYGTSAWPGFGSQTAPSGGAMALLGYDAAGTLRAVQVAGGQRSSGHTLTFDRLTNQPVVAGLSPDGATQLAPLSALPGILNTEAQVFVASFEPTFTPLGLLPAAAATASAVYPNPVEARATVHLTGTSLQEATLYDALGRLVDRHPLTDGTVASIDAPAQAGLYLLVVRDAAGSSSRRLLVE